MLTAQDYEDCRQLESERIAAERIRRMATVVVVMPPIPADSWNYAAYLDPEGHYGWGHTREAALDNLLREMGL